MPIKIKDVEGNEVEVFTQEDLENTVSQKLEEQKTSLTEDFDKRFEDLKPKNEEKPPEKKEEKPPENNNDNEPPAWFKPFADQVQQLSGNQQRQYIDGIVNTLDADKQKEVREKFSSMTGYEDSPEGLEQRANDAYLLVTGERPDSGAVDMQNISAAGGGKSNTVEKSYSETDKQIQDSLGVTEEDVKKYGNNKS